MADLAGLTAKQSFHGMAATGSPLVRIAWEGTEAPKCKPAVPPHRAIYKDRLGGE